MRDRRLADVAAGREVARADLATPGELPHDGQAGRVAQGLEELDIGVDQGRFRAWHADMVSMDVYIDNYRYSAV